MRYTCALMLAACLVPGVASAFCGTYVGGPGQELRNQGSQIVVARYGDRTTLTMVNHFEGDEDDFGLVIPMPSSIDANNVRTIDDHFMRRLELYSTPREVSFDCEDFYSREEGAGSFARYARGSDDTDDTGDQGSSSGGSWEASGSSGGCSGGGSWEPPADEEEDRSDPESWTDEEHDVVIEDHFDFGEYEAFVLSADDGDGLAGWLGDNGFVLEAAAAALLDEYLDGTFLAVRIGAGQIRSGGWLSPIQVDYTAPMVSLPIRLGAISSTGVQDLTLYTLATSGRGMISNYDEASIPSSCLRKQSLGLGQWYENAFSHATGVALDPFKPQSAAGWVLEYGWYTPPGEQVAKCDPCPEGTSGLVMQDPSEQPLTADDVAVLGLPEGLGTGFYTTRMHMRYTPDAVPRDLSIMTKSGIFDNFQLLWVQHAWELESLIESCGERPEDPGSCYSAEYLLGRAEDRAAGVPVVAYGSPEYCGGRGRAGLLLCLPIGLLLARRRR